MPAPDDSNATVSTILRNPNHVAFRFTYEGADLVLLSPSAPALAPVVHALRIGTARRGADGTWTLRSKDAAQMPRRRVPLKPSDRKARRHGR